MRISVIERTVEALDALQNTEEELNSAGRLLILGAGRPPYRGLALAAMRSCATTPAAATSIQTNPSRCTLSDFRDASSAGPDQPLEPEGSPELIERAQKSDHWANL
jgi:hypothetical protein